MNQLLLSTLVLNTVSKYIMYDSEIFSDWVVSFMVQLYYE